MNEEVNNNNFKPYMLWLLIFTFIAPIAAAYWLYNVGGTENTVNRGEFINPVVQLLDMQLQTVGGEVATEKQLYGHWHMMFFMNADCDKKCEETIYTMRQIKTSLHKESPRFVNLLIHFDKNISDEFRAKIESHYANFDRYIGDKEVFNRMLGYSGEELANKNIIFMVDPIGNVILKYSRDKTAKDIISDIKRLLKASQIG
ncbi:MAG: SCO family protein [Gammaproteobacteria bacterium]|nr:SCO family protein [Gammaproteobacteria bacterium]